jgi:DNA polymerase
MEKRLSEIKQCQECPLCKFRHQVVLGRGEIPCDILFIGEAPGVSEDLLGKAFIGESGRFLDKMIEKAGLAEVPKYFTNTVLCRPCDYKGGKNREPIPREIVNCIANVKSIIEQAEPKFIVLVGDVAQKQFSKVYSDSVKITHPSALLRSGGVRAQSYKSNLFKLARLYHGIGTRS